MKLDTSKGKIIFKKVIDKYFLVEDKQSALDALKIKIVIPFYYKKIFIVKMATVSRRHALPSHASTELK